MLVVVGLMKKIKIFIKKLLTSVIFLCKFKNIETNNKQHKLKKGLDIMKTLKQIQAEYAAMFSNYKEEKANSVQVHSATSSNADLIKAYYNLEAHQVLEIVISA